MNGLIEWHILCSNLDLEKVITGKPKLFNIWNGTNETTDVILGETEAAPHPDCNEQEANNEDEGNHSSLLEGTCQGTGAGVLADFKQ